MKKRISKSFLISLGLILGFILWTVAVCFIDVKEIGPENSSVGFSAVNQFVFNITGVHLKLYNITDWLGLVPVAVCIIFGMLGLIQWITRKKISEVDADILLLGAFYILVIVVYILFENIVINYRPVLINGYLEVSYPSSTTLLVMCVMPTSIIQFNHRIKRTVLKRIIILSIAVFIAFMVLGRLISGVHWFSDIMGGALISAGLVTMYYSLIQKSKK